MAQPLTSNVGPTMAFATGASSAMVGSETTGGTVTVLESGAVKAFDTTLCG